MVAKTFSRGFTIVELLIVIVVIAILAAITIVGYTGIQNRTREAALQTNVRQASSKLSAQFLLSGNTYAASGDFATVTGLVSDSATTYTYIVSSDQQNYCVSALNVSLNLSYASSNKAIAPVKGRCGTNYVTNPSFETNLSNWSFNGSSATSSTAWASSGTTSLQLTASTASADSFARFGNQTTLNGLTPGETFTITATSRLGATTMAGSLDSRARQIRVYAWNGATVSQVAASSGMPNTANAVATQTATFTVPTGSTGVEIRLYNGGSNANANNVFWDGVFITNGAQAMQYADGSTTGWYWDGDDNASRSSGPMQLL
jgi:prepilin-type N-terminal cleavage/methylation domain-containing protein